MLSANSGRTVSEGNVQCFIKSISVTWNQLGHSIILADYRVFHALNEGSSDVRTHESDESNPVSRERRGQDGDNEQSRPASYMVAYTFHHLSVTQDFRATHVVCLTDDLRAFRTPLEISQEFHQRDRLTPSLDPPRANHDGKLLYKLNQHLKRRTPCPQNNCRPKGCNRDGPLAKQAFHLPTTREVVREFQALPAQSPEIDDALYA
jgi:hypothetical protein